MTGDEMRYESPALDRQQYCWQSMACVSRQRAPSALFFFRVILLRLPPDNNRVRGLFHGVVAASFYLDAARFFIFSACFAFRHDSRGQPCVTVVYGSLKAKKSPVRRVRQSGSSKTEHSVE